VAENSTIRSSRSRRPVRKYLDTPSYVAGTPTSIIFAMQPINIIYVLDILP